MPPLTKSRPGSLCSCSDTTVLMTGYQSSPSASPCLLTCNTLTSLHTGHCTQLCTQHMYGNSLNIVANTLSNWMVLLTVAIMEMSQHLCLIPYAFLRLDMLSIHWLKKEKANIWTTHCLPNREKVKLVLNNTVLGWSWLEVWRFNLYVHVHKYLDRGTILCTSRCIYME